MKLSGSQRVLLHSWELVFFLRLLKLAGWKIYKGKTECVSCVIWEKWRPIFFLYCSLYDDLRVSIFPEMARQIPGIFWSTDNQKLTWLLNVYEFRGNTRCMHGTAWKFHLCHSRSPSFIDFNPSSLFYLFVRSTLKTVRGHFFAFKCFAIAPAILHLPFHRYGPSSFLFF